MPFTTFPEVADPTPVTVKVKVPPFTTPAALVTLAVRVTGCALTRKVAAAAEAVVVVVAAVEIVSDLLLSLLPFRLAVPL